MKYMGWWRWKWSKLWNDSFSQYLLHTRRRDWNCRFKTASFAQGVSLGKNRSNSENNSMMKKEEIKKLLFLYRCTFNIGIRKITLTINRKYEKVYEILPICLSFKIIILLNVGHSTWDVKTIYPITDNPIPVCLRWQSNNGLERNMKIKRLVVNDDFFYKCSCVLLICNRKRSEKCAQ